jgi:phage repressor protein C with HTH and peptisase S24 domain
MGDPVLTTREASYSILEVALPGRAPEPAGVLLYDPTEERLEVRLRRDWEELAEPEDVEVLELIEADLAAKVAEMGPAQVLEQLEETLSNVLRISGRETVVLGSFEATLNRLYRETIPATVLQFETHLPVYSCRAAAGRFGDQMQVEAEGWIEAPAGMKLTGDMFAARVVGRSMEPVIPDGSLCAFRARVVGSRQGKLLLVENFGESDEGGERYTVKRYRSSKRTGDKRTGDGGEWEHERIVMEPLNPEFEPWEIREEDRVRVLAEFVRVLE